MPEREKYNLQKLLEMREQKRDDAALYLAECHRQSANAEKELNNLKKAVEDCRLEQKNRQNMLVEKSTGGIKSNEIVHYRRHLSDLREQETELLAAVEELENVFNRAGQTVEKALADLNEAAKEMKIIEKHRENWQKAKKTATTSREQKSDDEIGAILYERRKSEQ